MSALVTVCFQTLQYGDGECERDVDGGAKNWQRQKEVQTCQQGSIYLQDVPSWRFCHSCATKPSSSLAGTLEHCIRELNTLFYGIPVGGINT